MPVIQIGQAGHILAGFEEYESSLTDPLFDAGERLANLHLVEDKTETGFALQIVGSKALLNQFMPYAGRGDSKTVRITVLPAGLCDGQSDPLTDGLWKTDKSGKVEVDEEGNPVIDPAQVEKLAPQGARTRRKRDPETDELISAEEFAERYPDNGAN